MIRVQGLTRRFGNKVAVEGLELEVYQGEVFGFLGHNGAGKTTTIRLLNGVLSPTAGEAWVLGYSVKTEGALLRRQTGVLTETPALDERLSALENLEIYAALFGVPPNEIAQRVRALLQTFALAERAGERVGGFSKGMKQRLALARTLLHQPQLLFLDEPTAGLDPVAAKEVHNLIARMKEQERTVFLTTHNLGEAQALCDRVAVMEQGKLRAIGTPAELARQLGGARLVLEVAPADQRKALEVVKVLNPSAMVMGDLQVSGVQREQVPRLVQALVQAGVAIYRVDLQTPSLEDIYFALHAREGT